jgi:anaerobic magnesium-protoporphyrin IX monomethyl ester cyclase
MTGHAGSTPAHPDVLAMAGALNAQLPGVPIVYGGVYPTYHGPEILSQEPAIDIIVRGEGERTAVALAAALAVDGDLSSVRGIVYRDGGSVRTTAPAEMIADIDEHRVGWELVEDWDLYQCWGMGRAAVVQFSRGCPHQCTYCGQRGFWTKWRYRDIGKTVAEIAYLHREHGVNFIDLADENPTSSKRVWRAFLEALAAEKLPIKLFATIRATDIVRDADILPLYKAAGIDCVLMGMETTDPQTIATIRKGSTTRDDFEAIRLLRQHGILSMVGHIVGFEEETAGDYWRALRQLLLYDPDLLNDVCHPASLDLLLPRQHRPRGDRGGPVALGLPAPDPGHPAFAALADGDAGETHRGRGASAAARALAADGASGPPDQARISLVRRSLVACVAGRDRGDREGAFAAGQSAIAGRARRRASRR